MKQKSENRLTNSRFWLCDRKMAGLILSGTIIMAGETMVLLANSIIAGHMIGETAIAAVNLVLPIYSFSGFIALLVSLGTAVRFSQETGRFNAEGTRKVFSQGVIAAIAIGIIAFALILCMKGTVLSSAEGSDELYSYASEYYSIIQFMALEYPMLALLLDTIYSDGGETITSLAYIPLMGGSIVLSVILCPVMGISGIAMGTVIGQLAAIITLCTHFFTKKCTLRFKWYFNLKDFLVCMKYSVADAGTYLCWAVLITIMNSFFLASFGETKLPVLSAVTSLMEITLIFDGVGGAVQPLAGVYRGENNTASIEHMMKTSEKMAIVEGIIVTAFVMAFPILFTGMLGIDNPELVQETVTAARIYAFSLTASSLMLLLSSYNLYMDRIGLVLLNIVMKDFAMPLICVLTFGKIIGIKGVWIGLSAGAILAMAATFAVTMLIKGRNDFPLYLDRSRERNQLIVNVRLTEKAGSEIPEYLENFLLNHSASRENVRLVKSSIERIIAGTFCKSRKGMYIELLADASEEKISIIMRDSGRLRETPEGEYGENIVDNVALGMNRVKIELTGAAEAAD